MTLAELLFEQVRKRPEHSFVVHDGGEISFAEMAALVSETADWLDQRGISAGDHVALLCPNRPRFLAAWLACVTVGAVCVPLGTWLVGEGLHYVLQQSDSRLLIADAGLLAEKRDNSAEALAGLEVLSLPEGEAPSERGSDFRKPLSQLGGAAAAILYTSGTTGRPKGAVIPHASYLAAGRQMAEALAVGPEDRIMVVLPLFHANPQMYAVTTALLQGCTLILRPKFSASAFFPDARRFGATAFTYVGTLLSILAKRNEGDVKEHAIRWCTGGGAPLDVWRDVEARFGFAVRELYGMTETGGWTSLNRADATRHGSVGALREDFDVAVLDEEDRVLPAGKSGEICVRPKEPDLCFKGYYKRDDLTWAASRNLWFHTGDRGHLDEDGYLYFDGRLKELIRRGGEMISPQEIELKLLEHAAVRDCAVVSVPDDILGEEIKAVVVAADVVEALALRAHLARHLPTHCVPRYFEFATEIPKTPTEKIERHKLTGLTEATMDLVGNRGERRETA